MNKNGKTRQQYLPEEKAAAVRMMRTLQAQLRKVWRTVQQVALQLGYGVESVRSWVRQADSDYWLMGGITSDGSEETRRLEQ